MTKTNVTVSVETAFIERARATPGFNISEAAELGICTALNLPPPMKQLNDKISQVLAVLEPKEQASVALAIEKSPNFARGQARLIAMRTGVSLKPNEVLALVGRIRGLA